MRLNNHYDWVVLGDSPGALISAGLVAKLGLSVLIVPFRQAYWMRASMAGRIFDPEPNFILGLESKEGSKSLTSLALQRMGALSSEVKALSSLGTTLGVLGPQWRFEISQSSERLQGEMARELGSQIAESLQTEKCLNWLVPQTYEYWATLPARLSLNEGKTTAQALYKKSASAFFNSIKRSSSRSGIRSEWTQDRSQFDWARGWSYAMTGMPTKSDSAWETLKLLSLSQAHTSFKGGMAAYRKYLLKLAERSGAHFPESTECRRIFVESGKLVGVQLSDRNHVIGATGAVLGVSLSDALGIMTQSGREWPHQMRASPKPIAWRFTLALQLRNEAIPPGLCTRTIWCEKGAPALDLELALPTDYGSLDRENRLLFARTLLPFTVGSLSPEFQRITAARMFRQITEILPFSEYHLHRVFPDFRKPDLTPFLEAYPFGDQVEKIPLEFRCFNVPGKGPRTGIEGLFAASPESYSEMGNFGETVAAIEASSWIAHRMGVAGPFG